MGVDGMVIVVGVVGSGTGAVLAVAGPGHSSSRFPERAAGPALGVVMVRVVLVLMVKHVSSIP
jgi:hypothetical protein